MLKNGFSVPKDIQLRFPTHSILKKEDRHFLIYIPWDDKYLKNIPSNFKDFFKCVLPFLKTRTTDVHTAISLGYAEQLFSKFEEKINKRVVIIALILHDAGWSRLSEQEVANSLGVNGLKLNKTAIGPKEKHAIESVNIAKQVLSQYSFDPKLTNQEKKLIINSIRYHDQPEKVSSMSFEIPLELKLLVDLDHIWSFTHENFWQDTIRKGVEPKKYLQNLEHDLDDYFVTKQGRKLATQLLSDRKQEINE